MSAPPIYHIVPLSEVRPGVREGGYTPARFVEDGFIHCAAGRDTVLAVANDYYASAPEPVMLLEIDTDRLIAAWRFEPAAPLDGGGTAHLEIASEFPHVYGALNLAAIVGIGTLVPGGNSFGWPSKFVEFDAFLRTGPD